MLACAAALSVSCAASPTLIERDDAGFALYRSGRHGEQGVERMCRLGVMEILVLDGSGEGVECRYREESCPDLQVRYDNEQRPDVPLSAGFLREFDRWIEDARAEGKTVALRCRHGWHRAGRLSAYYEMKFMGADVEKALKKMHDVGRLMWRHRYLDPQVRALNDYIHSRPCSTEPQHCVRQETDANDVAEPFPSDVCL